MTVSRSLVDAWCSEDNIFLARRQYIVFHQASLLRAMYDHNTRSHGLCSLIEFVSLPVLFVALQEQAFRLPKASPLVYPSIAARH